MDGETVIDEVGDRIYRVSTYLFDLLTFNQYLVVAEQPLLFHCGMRAIFDQVSDAVARVMPIDDLRWITFGHVEADESGSMNSWLAAAPQSQVAHGATGCIVQVADLADRPPIGLDDGATLDLGDRTITHFETPHVPHSWDAGLIYEEATGTLFCGDLFTQASDAPATSTDDIVGPAMTYEDMLPYSSLGPTTVATIRRLADLNPTSLAMMHGPVFQGDCRQALVDLATQYEQRIAAMSTAGPSS
jgi:flavorubredoxin